MSHRSRSHSRSSRDGLIVRSALSTDAELQEQRAQQRADRDVRSVGRRLQQNQVETASTLGLMHDRMEAMAAMQAQMASMMQRIEGNLYRLLPEEGTNTTPSPHTGNGRAFTTPPACTNT